MRFIADFHIHSHYSRAVSKDMNITELDTWAKRKGIAVMGTGDFTHPEWIKELQERLEPAPEEGLFIIKSEAENSKSQTRFLLTVEISCIYSKAGKVRKVHVLVFAPSFEAAQEINKQLGWRGNLHSDGRPILGLDVKELAKIVFGASDKCMVVPAHAWTPWFSVFGSMSGFDSLEECFEELTPQIYAIETGLSCYDSKTEVLTAGGWKKISTVLYSDKICTLNTKTNEIVFQRPNKIFAYPYQGKMYRLKTKRIDLLVTPNHKLLYAPCDFRKSPVFTLKEAELLIGKSKRFKKDGMWKGQHANFFVLPAVKMKHGSRYYSGFRYKQEKQLAMVPWLKFFGLWIAEGWTTEGKNGDYNVCLANNNQELLSEIKQILNDFGYDPYFLKGLLRVRDYQLFSYLRSFGKSHKKFIPSAIKLLSKELLEIFLQYYIKGDGHIYGRNGKGLSATTASSQLRDDLQEVALKIGFSAYYKRGRKKGTLITNLPYGNKLYKQSSDIWVIYFVRKNQPIVLPSTIKKYKYIEKWISYNDAVYCVSVPNKVIYIRRNGIPLWCGNSDPLMNWRVAKLDSVALLSNSDSHSGRKIGREANIFEGVMSYSAIHEAIKYGAPSRANEREGKPTKFIGTIEFFPEEGKYHYDGHRLCKISWTSEETKAHQGKCTVCGKKVTVGVMSRVDDLATRSQDEKPQGAPQYTSMVPLEEIIASCLGVGAASKAVQKEYEKLLTAFGSEFEILLNADADKVGQESLSSIAEGLKRVREGRVHIEPGYDGEFGKVEIFTEEERNNFKAATREEIAQSTLF